MAEQHPINGLMGTSMDKIRELVDVNTIIGDPITSPDGTIIIPVSKVSFGFVAGGSDLPTKAPKEVFAGGSGAGITINPQAFIVVQRDGDVKMLELGATGNSAIDGIISGVPDLISKIKAIFSKDGEEESEEISNNICPFCIRYTKTMRKGQRYAKKDSICRSCRDFYFFGGDSSLCRMHSTA